MRAEIGNLLHPVAMFDLFPGRPTGHPSDSRKTAGFGRSPRRGPTFTKCWQDGGAGHYDLRFRVGSMRTGVEHGPPTGNSSSSRTARYLGWTNAGACCETNLRSLCKLLQDPSIGNGRFPARTGRKSSHPGPSTAVNSFDSTQSPDI